MQAGYCCPVLGAAKPLGTARDCKECCSSRLARDNGLQGWEGINQHTGPSECPQVPTKPLLEAESAQGIRRAEATQHQARVGGKKPLPLCDTIPSCHNTLIPYTGDWLQDAVSSVALLARGLGVLPCHVWVGSCHQRWVLEGAAVLAEAWQGQTGIPLAQGHQVSPCGRSPTPAPAG